MAKKKDSDLYIEETEIWLKQSAVRLASCERMIRNNKDEASQLLEANKLERAQMRLIRRRIAGASKDLAAYKRKNLKNK